MTGSIKKSRMHPFVAATVWGVSCYATAADEPSLSTLQCPVAPLAMPELYERPHQIPTTPKPDDPNHKMITPGGMLLETPRMVAATDTLTISGRDSSALCFRVVTFARNRNRCEISGVARADERGTYVFTDNEVALRLLPLALGQIRVEPVGDGYRKRCEPAGRIDAAIYSLRSAAQP